MESKELATATFGGGCFWCTEAVFLELRGVESVVSGYCGGTIENPTYEQVCTGSTGHAEVIQIRFDPTLVTFDDLLDVFFRTHDPTTLNRQGADVGTQYRSVVYYHDPQQKETTESFIQQLNDSGEFASPIVTEVSPAPKFFPAEEYHQNYLERNPAQSYCAVVVRPKVDKVREKFPDKLK